MKIGVFDPYLDTLGGGERYVLSIASCLSSSHKVSLFWNDAAILDTAEKKLGLKLGGINLVKNIFAKDVGTLTRAIRSSYYDVIFYISDGSLPLLLSKKQIPIFQYPIPGINGISFVAKVKLLNATTILCYSDFIKSFLEKIYDRPITVLYPPVHTVRVQEPRENIILSVGRFTQGKNTKKQDFIVDFFTKHVAHFRGWRLVLIGSVLQEDREFVDELKRRTAQIKSVEIITDVSFQSLIRNYARAKIYLHAAGFGEDVKMHPERAEHFGISVVEAMAQGTVPIAYDGGGPSEIIYDGVNGYLYKTDGELLQKLQKLMSNKGGWQTLSEEAVKRAGDFSEQTFCEALVKLV